MEEEQIWGTRETEGVEGKETVVGILCLRKETVFNKNLKFKVFLYIIISKGILCKNH